MGLEQWGLKEDNGISCERKLRARAGLTAKSRLRLKSTVRVPSEALGDEVDKELVIRLENLSKRLRARPTTAAL